ncbi:peptidoglycan-binding domain-containing protein [Nostoc sp. WHI]|uniref:peptidoglycan-binding domain-containing protein n=1 Tax=Nostoc sp. WHI TaxID=2650611 RepID=UPI0018C7EB48|nr:peptidoglycan-binding domain-containing protein [Nostoc sp. WHI]MBG1266845.1 peptidoglycan-binding protein [Nostoc sp. WHI]
MESFTPGTSSEGIKHLQERLQEFGFYQKAFTGNFDQTTQDAIKEFQEANGLAVDGIVGLMTLHALDLLELGLVDIS